MSRFPPNLGKIATSLYTIIAGNSQTHIISDLGLGRRLVKCMFYMSFKLILGALT